MKRILPLIALFVLLAGSVQAQDPQAQRQAIEKLGFLVGEWRGEAWTLLPDGSRLEMNQTERVTAKVGGLVLVIEGEGTDKSTGAPLFGAFGTIFHDFQSNDYRMYGVTTDGRNGEMRMELLGENRVRWSPEGMGASVRYTIELTEEGEWLEQGEYSQDGQEWFPFFEMRLHRTDV